jgi:hypothetical protein
VLLAWLVGCVSTVFSENGQVQLQATDVSTLGWLLPAGMLAGTTTCPSMSWGPSVPYPPDPSPQDCFDIEAQGDGEFDGDCLSFVERGELVLDFQATCPGLIDDAVRFEVLSPEEVVARPLELERLVMGLLEPGPDDLPPSQPEDEPWRVVERGWVRFFPVLYDAADHLVGYELDEMRVVTDPELMLIEAGPGYGSIVMLAGMEGTVSSRYEDERYPWDFDLVEVHGVAQAEAASLQIFPVYERSGSYRKPVGARAVVKDAADNLLWGAPVRWWLDEGELAYGELGERMPGPDYVLLLDDCRPPDEGGPRRAVLRAELGELAATTELLWTPKPASAVNWHPHPECAQGGPYDPPGAGGRTGGKPPPPPPPPPEPSWRKARWSGGCAHAGPAGQGSGALLMGLWALRLGSAASRARARRPAPPAGSASPRSSR